MAFKPGVQAFLDYVFETNVDLAAGIFLVMSCIR